MRKVRLIATALWLALVLASVASAGTPSTKQYSNPIKHESPPTKPAGSHLQTTGHPSSGSLPFTGFDLALVLVGGGGAVAGGLVLRRVGRRRPS